MGAENKPLISIITVVYNAAGLLQATLDSIVEQDYQAFELIVIDGKSTDGTLEIIESNSSSISYWKSEPDQGIYDAMNKGLQVAIGEYVLFINAGDKLYDSQTLSRVMAFAPEADIIFGKTMLIDELGHELGERRLKPPVKLNWRSFQKGMLVSHQAFIARKSLANFYNLEFKISSDIDWCIRAMKAATVLVNSETFIARYLVGGLSRQSTQLAWKERFQVMHKNYGLFPTLLSHIYIILRFVGYYSRSRKLD